MAMVSTVLGPVAGGELGAVLMHEHIICDLEHSKRGWVAVLQDVSLASHEVAAFREAGGGTIVELTPSGAGRDVGKLRDIALASGIHIVAPTGFYTEPYYPRIVFELTTDKLADLMYSELAVGIDDSGIRAGIIGELGTGRRFISPAEERVFVAAAQAQKASDVAISTHTYWGELALEQVRILRREGVSSDRIIVGHLGDTRDVSTYKAIATTGVFMQFDHIGKNHYLPDRDRAELIGQLVNLGFVNQIVLSGDVSGKESLHHYGGCGYDHVLRMFIPALLAAGVSEEAVNRMLVDNPRLALTGVH